MPRTANTPKPVPLASSTAQSAVWDAVARSKAQRGVCVGDTQSRVADPHPDAHRGECADASTTITVRRGAPSARNDWFLPRYATSNAHAVCVLRKPHDALHFVRDSSCTRVVVWHADGRQQPQAALDDDTAWRHTLRDAAVASGELHDKNAPGRHVVCVCVVVAAARGSSAGWDDVHDAVCNGGSPSGAPLPLDAPCTFVLRRGRTAATRVQRATRKRSAWLQDVVQAVGGEGDVARVQTLAHVMPTPRHGPPSNGDSGAAASGSACEVAVAAAWVRGAAGTTWRHVLREAGVDAIAFLSASRPCTLTGAPPLVPWLGPEDTMVHSMRAALAFAPEHVRSRVLVVDAVAAGLPHLPRCAWVQGGPCDEEGAGGSTPDANKSHTTLHTSPYAVLQHAVPHCTPLYSSRARRACLLFLLRHGASMRTAVLHFSS